MPNGTGGYLHLRILTDIQQLQIELAHAAPFDHANFRTLGEN